MPYSVGVTLLLFISEPQESDHDYQPVGGTGKVLKLFTFELNRFINGGTTCDSNKSFTFVLLTWIC